MDAFGFSIFVRDVAVLRSWTGRSSLVLRPSSFVLLLLSLFSLHSVPYISLFYSFFYSFFFLLLMLYSLHEVGHFKLNTAGIYAVLHPPLRPQVLRPSKLRRTRHGQLANGCGLTFSTCFLSCLKNMNIMNAHVGLHQ